MSDLEVGQQTCECGHVRNDHRMGRDDAVIPDCFRWIAVDGNFQACPCTEFKALPGPALCDCRWDYSGIAPVRVRKRRCPVHQGT